MIVRSVTSSTFWVVTVTLAWNSLASYIMVSPCLTMICQVTFSARAAGLSMVKLASAPPSTARWSALTLITRSVGAATCSLLVRLSVMPFSPTAVRVNS